MFNEDICTVNISKLNFWLVICIAKNLILTTLKMIFSIFRFCCILRFQIYKYCPIITNHTSMEILLFSSQMMHASQFWETGFVLQGHIYICILYKQIWIASELPSNAATAQQEEHEEAAGGFVRALQAPGQQCSCHYRRRLCFGVAWFKHKEWFDIWIIFFSCSSNLPWIFLAWTSASKSTIPTCTTKSTATCWTSNRRTAFNHVSLC